MRKELERTILAKNKHVVAAINCIEMSREFRARNSKGDRDRADWCLEMAACNRRHAFDLIRKEVSA